VSGPEREHAREFLRARTAVAHDRTAALADLCLALFNANEFVTVD
jgi:hypothetical protein